MNSTENVWTIDSRDLKSDIGGPIIGIDLGTTNSCIAIWHPTKNRAKIIKNLFSGRTTPSTITFGDSFDVAKIGLTTGKEITGIKILIGKSHIDELPMELLDEIETDGNGELGIRCFTTTGESTLCSADYLSSLVLKYLKQCAEEYLRVKPIRDLPANCSLTRTDGEVKRAVIGVPAHFSELERNATRNAARIAGFQEVHLMVESTAATAAYGLLVAGKKTAMVLDMGGGTLDITVTDISDGAFQVVAQGGSSCGGRTMDALLLERLVRCARTHHLALVTSSEEQDPAVRSSCREHKEQLMSLCRLCRETLSTCDKALLQVPISLLRSYLQSQGTFSGVAETGSEDSTPQEFFRASVEGVNLVMTVTHDTDLAVILAPALAIVTRTVQRVLTEWRNAGARSLSEKGAVIDEVVLVGGCTRMPLVRKALRCGLAASGVPRFDEAGDGEFCTSIDPDEAVAQGLAIRAGVLMGVDKGLLKNLLMIDAIPTSIGIRTFDEGDDQSFYFEPILVKGMKLPASAAKLFVLESVDQRLVSIDVYEQADDCDEDSPILLIGTYDVPVPPRDDTTKTANKVEVVLNMSEGGSLSFFLRWPGSPVPPDKPSDSKSFSANTILFLCLYLALLAILYVFMKTYLFVDHTSLASSHDPFSEGLSDPSVATRGITAADINNEF